MYITGQCVRVKDGSEQCNGVVKSVEFDGSQVEVLWSTANGVEVSANFYTETKQIVGQEEKPDPCYLID